MFTLILEKSDIVNVLHELKKDVSVYPLEVDENGIQFSVMDDNKNMGIWIKFDQTLPTSFEFEGDGVERYIVASGTFADAAKKTSYPLEIGSFMDGSLKISSANGRQKYKIKQIEDKNPEQSEYYRERFKTFEDADAITVRVLRQNIMEALRTVAVASKDVDITLDDDVFVFNSSDIEIDAEAVAPLVEAVKGSWKRGYNVKILQDLLKLMSANSEVIMHLYLDKEEMLIHLPLDDIGKSFCKVVLAPTVERGVVEEEEESD